MERKHLGCIEYSDYSVSQDGKVFGPKGELSQFKGGDGYLRVMFNHKNMYVHRIVALAWVPNTKNLKRVRHKDKNKMNNIVDNLLWW